MQFINILHQHLPSVISWIETTLNHYSSDKISLSKSGHSRLNDYFPASLLDKTYAVYTDEIPVVPLLSTGIPQLIFMNEMPAAGITYQHTFFILQSEKHNTSIHFHELIHVLQWEYLGIEKFLLCYGHGLISHGYFNSPLEEMAYGLQSRFDKGEIFDAVSIVNEMMRPLEQLAEELIHKK